MREGKDSAISPTPPVDVSGKDNLQLTERAGTAANEEAAAGAEDRRGKPQLGPFQATLAAVLHVRRDAKIELETSLPHEILHSHVTS